VGENLQDHLEFNFQYRCKQPISLNSKLGLLQKAFIGAQWLLFKTGLGRTNHFEACAFIRSRAGVSHQIFSITFCLVQLPMMVP
jgi:choline dehydrogenase